MKNTIIDFFRKPDWFVKNTSGKTILIIFLTNLVVKTTYNVISSHKFPPEMNFDFAGIVNPSIAEFITAHFISDFLFFGIFLIYLTIHINEKILIKIFVDLITITLSIIFILNYSRPVAIIYIASIILLSLFFLKRNYSNYITSLKIMISIQILNILSTMLLYISELFSSNILFIATLFAYSILSFGYFIRLLRSFYEVSVKKIMFYSIISIIVAVIYGFSIHKADIFSENIIKLILYN